jgi:hypothetical protein
MLLNNTNLLHELLLERQNAITEESLLADVKRILDDNEKKRNQIKDMLNQQSSTIANEFDSELLTTERIFHINQIKTICIDYRLRFLDSHLFKPSFPEEAISAIAAIEKEHQTQLNGFKIMAPSKLFHLKSYDDPLLFAPIGNGYYYLILKWGNDLHPLRKWMMKPFKTIGNFTLLMAFISLVLAFIIPINILGKTSEGVFRLIAFLFIFKAVVAIALYYCFWKGKNFNESIWNSPYYN